MCFVKLHTWRPLSDLFLWFLLQNFTPEFNAIYVDEAFEGEKVGQNINRVVIEHFLRQGQLDIAESLIEVNC